MGLHPNLTSIPITGSQQWCYNSFRWVKNLLYLCYTSTSRLNPLSSLFFVPFTYRTFIYMLYIISKAGCHSPHPESSARPADFLSLIPTRVFWKFSSRPTGEDLIKVHIVWEGLIPPVRLLDLSHPVPSIRTSLLTVYATNIRHFTTSDPRHAIPIIWGRYTYILSTYFLLRLSYAYPDVIWATVEAPIALEVDVVCINPLIYFHWRPHWWIRTHDPRR